MNDMRKLMEAVRLNEYDIDDYDNDFLVEILAERVAAEIVEDIGDSINQNPQAVMDRLSQYVHNSELLDTIKSRLYSDTASKLNAMLESKLEAGK